MIPVSPAHFGLHVVAYREPCLSEVAFFQVVRALFPSILVGIQTRVSYATNGIPPLTGDGSRDGRDLKFAFRIRLTGAPGPGRPVDIVE